ncbi:kinase-like domain-containing protein [Gigaspora rosea]|uniref:Kinase-like domain-containing protein n=1 Tax=Gigaspora rosea TaxID=44941 RepID=A0A397VQP3_9GLOM|nr:kinase-like domain-containing protein [Gigaspora rosea]
MRNKTYMLNRESRYGKCAHCNEDNTNKAWCISCDPDITTRWTIRNKEIDHFMKTFQLRTWGYEGVIEWIPFDRLTDIEEIGKGGFGSVYKATWLDGVRKVDGNDFNYLRARDPSSIVALKTFSGPLKEVDNYMKCNISVSQLKIYGLTQDSENKYLVVFQYANNGNLYQLLKTKFQDFTWKTKLKLLGDIVNDLGNIHLAGYIHANLHGGNILNDQGINTNLKSYVSDLGMSKKKDENDLESDIYGVMPYVAPEVLLGKKFTNAADIYSIGVIMSEMSTGQRAFDGYEFDTKLAVKICKGLRPGFISGTPDCYIELANQCMNSDPQKRPDVHIIWDKFQKWNESMESSNNSNEIVRQFLEADRIVKTLPLKLPKHPDYMYTSKIINTKKISIEINNIN